MFSSPSSRPPPSFVQSNATSSVNMTVFTIDYELPALALRPGTQYFVTVQAGPRARRGAAGLARMLLDSQCGDRCRGRCSVLKLSSPVGLHCITLQAYNDGGRKAGTLLSSQPIMVDISPPALPDGSGVYNGAALSDVASQARHSVLAPAV